MKGIYVSTASLPAEVNCSSYSPAMAGSEQEFIFPSFAHRALRLAPCIAFCCKHRQGMRSFRLDGPQPGRVRASTFSRVPGVDDGGVWERMHHVSAKMIRQLSLRSNAITTGLIPKHAIITFVWTENATIAKSLKLWLQTTGSLFVDDGDDRGQSIIQPIHVTRSCRGVTVRVNKWHLGLYKGLSLGEYITCFLYMI